MYCKATQWVTPAGGEADDPELLYTNFSEAARHRSTKLMQNNWFFEVVCDIPAYIP
jgi:hypothetical protein